LHSVQIRIAKSPKKEHRKVMLPGGGHLGVSHACQPEAHQNSNWIVDIGQAMLRRNSKFDGRQTN
jgi:hypothetical protein